MTKRGRRLALALGVITLAGVGLLRTRPGEPTIPGARLDAAQETLSPLCDAGVGHADASTRTSVDALGAIDVRLLLGRGVPEALAARQLARLRSYFAPRGLTIRLRDARRLSIDELLTLDAPGLDHALEAQRLDPHADGDTEREATAKLLLSPLGTFLAAHADGGAGSGAVVQIVLLHRISAIGSVARRVLPGLRGLALDGHGALADLPPALRHALGDASGPPTLFISLDDLAPEGSGIVDTTLMHELGHAMGLAHVEDATNLMSAQPHRCIPELDPAQRRALRSRLAAQP